jgi:tetratricopeptide (TPR) repeat protein
MCLYRPLLALIPDVDIGARHGDGATIELAFWRASAKFMHDLPHRIADYDAADMSVFEAIALHAPDAVPAGFNATAMVFVHKAKSGAAVDDLAAWARRFENALGLATRALDAFTAELFTSRFYRGTAFLPQRRGDRTEVVRIVDLAERHAMKLLPATPAQELLYRENLHALMESRTKEALWLDDKDQALARSLRVVEVDPCDAKAWAELGEVRYLRKEWQEAAQAYATAAMLGPPASALGRHMAGVCLRELGHDQLGALLFKDAAEFDPLGISPREEIHDLPDVPVLRALKEWSRTTAEW